MICFLGHDAADDITNKNSAGIGFTMGSRIRSGAATSAVQQPATRCIEKGD